MNEKGAPVLTPEDIDSKRFSTTRIKEGYDQDEVDTFLDEVGDAYKVLDARVVRLEAENATLRRQVAAAANATTAGIPIPVPPTVVAERLLEVAQKAADETLAEAKEKADAEVRKAGARGAEIVEEAEAAAERLRKEGVADRYRELERINSRADEATELAEEMRSRADSVAAALTAALKAYDEKKGTRDGSNA